MSRKVVPSEETIRLVESRTVLPLPKPSDRTLTPQKQEPESGEVGNIVKVVPQYSKAFRYDYGAINQTLFPSLEYTICEPPPYKPGVNSLERGVDVLITGEDGQTVTTDGPYASAKGDMCMRGGSWYFEIDVIQPNVRIGIARREASCEGPVGYDSYSYGVQDSKGMSVHCARTKEFMEPFGPGDTIGFHVYLPISSRPRQIVRSRVPLKLNDQIWLESINYRPTLEMERYILPKNYHEPRPEDVISGSFCNVYRNGTLVGPLAEPLRDFRPPHSKFDFWLHLPPADDGALGYYPIISAYKGGAARFNFGPEFRGKIPEGARGLYERYDAQIADDFAVDLIDEVVFEEIDEKMPPDQQLRHKLKAYKEKKTVVKKLFA